MQSATVPKYILSESANLSAEICWICIHAIGNANASELHTILVADVLYLGHPSMVAFACWQTTGRICSFLFSRTENSSLCCKIIPGITTVLQLARFESMSIATGLSVDCCLVASRGADKTAQSLQEAEGAYQYLYGVFKHTTSSIGLMRPPILWPSPRPVPTLLTQSGSSKILNHPLRFLLSL